MLHTACVGNKKEWRVDGQDTEQLREMCIFTEKHYFDAIWTHIRMESSISSLSIHYLSILLPNMGSIPQCWTEHNHMTDGKSILSGSVLIEHMAGEQ